MLATSVAKLKVDPYFVPRQDPYLDAGTAQRGQRVGDVVLQTVFDACSANQDQLSLQHVVLLRHFG